MKFRLVIRNDKYPNYTQVLLQRRKWYGWSLVRKEKTNNPMWFVKEWSGRYGVQPEDIFDLRYSTQ